MNSINEITKALAAGAAAVFRPNRTGGPVYKREIADDYVELKEMIRAQYPQVDVDLLDIGPGSAERQQLISKQLQETGAINDEAIQQQAQRLLQTISEKYPEALWASEEADPAPQHK